MAFRPLTVAATFAGLVLAATAPGAAVAGEAEPLPTQEVAPGVFVYQAPYKLLGQEHGGAIANVGFVVGRDAVAVIDTGNTPEAGRRLLAAVRQKTKLPVRYVVNTHMHPDHVLGNVAFKGEGVEFVGSAKLERGLRARAQSYVDAAKRQTDGEVKLTMDDVVTPNVAVEDKKTIDLGDRTLELEAWPTAHTDNDLTILDVKTSTWFLGDLLFAGHVPTVDGSLEGWLKLMPKLEQRKVARVVPGHGPATLSWPNAAAPQQRYFDRVRADVKKLLDDGADLRTASEKAGLSEREAWALFDEFNARNAIAAYRELEWQ